MSKWISVSEAADCLGVPPVVIEGAIHRGRLMADASGRFVPRKTITEWTLGSVRS